MSGTEDAVRTRVTDVLRADADAISDHWVRLQLGRASEAEVREAELREEADALIVALLAGLESGTPVERVVASRRELHQTVVEFAMRRARRGATPTGTALAVLALKEALLAAMKRQTGDAEQLLDCAMLINRLLDSAGALTFETFVEGREEIIRRQSRQLLEVSTPVVQLWRQVVAVPLIGTLDTARAQVVMENLLEAIQEKEALVAIIDITGVPTVDTSVAQHLIQTVNAVRLMGADCVISGIRPPIAQTIAQLGIDLSTILTRATLADALAAAVKLTGPGAALDTVAGR
ncbi:STAS domain-containing protein [Streptomyces sp. NPDC048650]|uniref:STAS domain-containing protein n=1 Tax=Streptomyces sp. NPDC048650 TaxID=3365583 RepID=UPI00371248E5